MSGSLGRATLDLDANMAPLEQSLRRTRAEVQSWISNIERNRLTPRADTAAAMRDLQQLTTTAQRLNTLQPTINVRTNAQSAITSMQGATRSAGQMGTASKKAGADMSAAFDGALDSMLPISPTMAGIGTGAGIAAVAVGKFALDSLRTFGEFEAGMQQVWTLLPDYSQSAMDRMSQQVLDFATDMNVLPTQVIPALYDALGSGVPVDNVFTFLEVAQKAAIGGNTQLAVSTDALTSVVNAYGAENLSAARAADVYFQAIALGKVSFDQLGGSMYDVAPIAASLGVELEQVAAVYATMTAQGVPARVVGTQLRQVLLELSDATSDVGKTFQQVSGQAFPEFIANGGTLQEALVLLDGAAADSGVTVNQLFSSVEAGQAAIALTGDNAAKAASDLDAMGASAGATDAAHSKMMQGLKQDTAELSVSMQRLKIGIGEALAPLAGAVLGVAVENVNALVFAVERANDAFGIMGSVLGLIPGPLLKIVETAARLAFLPTAIGPIGDAIGFVGDKLGITGDEANSFSMAPVVSELQRVRQEADLTRQSLDMFTLIGPILPELLEGPTFSEHLIGGVESFTEWLQINIPAAGEAALDSIDTVVAGIDSGFVDATAAVDAFVRNGDVGFSEFVELASSKLAELEQARAQAFADDDAQGLSAANQQIAIYSDLIAEATRRADEFSAAQSNWNSTQLTLDAGVQTASDNIQEWQSDLSEAEKALGILNDKKEAGIPLTEQEASQYETLSWWVERTTGGIEDQEGAYVDAVTAKAKFAQLQDEIATKYPDLAHGSDEWKAALTEAGIAAGMSEEQIAGLISGSGDLQTTIGDLVTAINDLLVGLGLIPPETDATVTVDTVVAEEAIGTVQEGFTEFDGGEAQGTLTVDSSDATAKTDEAAEKAQTFRDDEYRAVLEADNSDAVGNSEVAQKLADIFRDDGPYTATLTADDQASSVIDSAQTKVYNLTSGSYTVRITADISDLEAGVAAAGSLLPHSPADEGPLAYQPTWDWAFEGARAAAERHVGDAARSAAEYLPVDGDPSAGALSGPVDWSWLFADIPADAEDYAAQTADSFVSFLLGNLDEIANGEAMYDAQAKLAELLAIRDIAVSQNLGADVIAEIEAQIEAQRREIEAIGAVAGSGFVDGFKDEVAQFDIGAALNLPDSGSPWNLDDIVSGDALQDTLDAIADMQSMLDIAREAGDEELVAYYTEQLAELQRQLEVLYSILDTKTVQSLEDAAAAMQAAEDAAEAAAKATADMVDAFLRMGSDPVGAVESAYSAVDALWKAVHAAVLAGAPGEVVEELLRQYNEALAAATFTADQAAQMYQMGLISDEELREMGEAGGQAFIDAFNAAMGNPNAWADLEAAWDMVRQKSIEELRAMIPDMEDGGVSLIAPLVQGVLDGTQDFDDALSLLNDIAAQNGEGLEETLGNLYLSLMEDLQEAFALGTDTTIIEQNMQIIRDILASLGLEIDDVLAAAANAARAAQTWNKGQALTRSGSRGSSANTAPLYDYGYTAMDGLAAMASAPSVLDTLPPHLTSLPIAGNGNAGWAQMASQGAAPIVNVNVNSQHTIDGRPLYADVIQRIESDIPAGMRS